MLAWTQIILKDAGNLEDWSGFPEELIPSLVGIERALRACRKDEVPHVVTETESWCGSVLGTVYFRRIYDRFKQAKPHYSYENLWSQQARAPRPGGVVSKPQLDSLLAGYDFTDQEPELTGCAMSASWNGIVHQPLVVDYLADGETLPWFLCFVRPGTAELRMSSAIPPKATAAELVIFHSRPARWPLPNAGRVRVRITIGQGEHVLEREVFPILGPLPLTLPLDRYLLLDRKTLKVRLTQIRATAIYRVDSVEIRFQVDSESASSPK
jgi:hypothetical protein